MGTEPTKKFEAINHTADVGLDVYGKTVSKLFENAAEGMFSLITPLDKVKEKIVISVSISAHDREELLVTFLNELLYYYSAKKVLFKRFEIHKLGETSLDADVSGDKIAGHEILHDIKAATYHDLKIEQTDGGCKTRIIFDV